MATRTGSLSDEKQTSETPVLFLDVTVMQELDGHVLEHCRF